MPRDSVGDRGYVKVDPDNDPYDPRKPEYLKPATQKEVDEANFRLLEEQIARLEAAAANRAAEDPHITHHYESVVDEMRAVAARYGRKHLSHARTRSAPQPEQPSPSPALPQDNLKAHFPYYPACSPPPEISSKKTPWLPMVAARNPTPVIAPSPVPLVTLDLRVAQPQQEEGVKANSPPETRSTDLLKTGPGTRLFSHRRVRSAPGPAVGDVRLQTTNAQKEVMQAKGLKCIKEEEVGFISF
mmetsp:Transcript_11712/g.27286  ORF Transcript_11712/g.27286 Transcript_11712/m.27286 type:complete len:243 (+) Transcript_11712:74-802(+)